MAVSSPSKKMDTHKQKRTKCPGVRVVGARIYDSENGKSCHQCRQKTMDFAARCKNIKNEKQCTIMFCHKCLHNRYGENAEEKAMLDDWNCPKCRDICNCSNCRKKKGHKPTGILIHAAKATRFTSVSQLLDVKGPNVSKEVIVQGMVASPKKPDNISKGQFVSSPNKRGKENSVDGTCSTNLNLPNSKPAGKKAKKTDKNKLKAKFDISQDNGTASSPIKDNVATVLRRSPRKIICSLECKQEKPDDKKANALRKSPRKSNIPQEVTKKKDNMASENCGDPSLAKIEKKPKVQAEVKPKKNKFKEDKSINDYVIDVVLPPGTLLTNVAGIDLAPQDAGYALQFLEFCSSFGEVLKIRKGQPECVLRDMLSGRRRKGKCSSSVQFIMQLLSFMVEESEDSEESPSNPTDSESSWTHSLKKCLNEADLAPEDIPEGWFDKGGDDRYDMLDSSQKLRLLTFLCDEALSNVEMRNWIEEQNLKFVEKGKEAKESLNAAKEKEKLIKRRLQEDIAKAVMAKNGLPLTISEHESIVAEIKAESKRVQEEISNATGLASKKRQRSDAVRTESIILDDNGRAYFRLSSLGDTILLLQDMGAIEALAPNDKWLSFDEAEITTVENYMSAVRLKRHRINKLADETMTKRRSSSPEGDSTS